MDEPLSLLPSSTEGELRSIAADWAAATEVLVDKATLVANARLGHEYVDRGEAPPPVATAAADTEEPTEPQADAAADGDSAGRSPALAAARLERAAAAALHRCEQSIETLTRLVARANLAVADALELAVADGSHPEAAPVQAAAWAAALGDEVVVINEAVADIAASLDRDVISEALAVILHGMYSPAQPWMS
ncbi:uncharacterized protein AMSG_11689 [Thecamonas trahens ATCC 50062]|uniref:Uncharacterized protein n=1 Tax=Thecamonas trahens ATCC 50062 TaxID=461836 RepID=A0A0L0DVN0_THETB|nr:hypothetical protein AMSG_11689 [Thecamonas trahens ATCC 50062]KNC56131.1 hypothetical protein AMSG_11689 [Thecamonas trahens ATCC 50062]|eukprot:XP_013761228.1 hypothetical protein AMSG_11689 [Thecamonas trahens ATCC 50062]